MNVRQTDEFAQWLRGLRDRIGKARIAARLYDLQQGHFGDVKSVGDGVSEMRIHSGPGYRLYFTRRGQTIVVLLIGGDKDTQRRDIARAKELARDLGD